MGLTTRDVRTLKKLLLECAIAEESLRKVDAIVKTNLAPEYAARAKALRKVLGLSPPPGQKPRRNLPSPSPSLS